MSLNLIPGKHTGGEPGFTGCLRISENINPDVAGMLIVGTPRGATPREQF